MNQLDPCMEKKMKKILFAVLICLVLIGCTNKDANPVVDNSPKPAPIVLGMVECPECRGDGKIDIEKESIHCPRCDGFGFLNEVEIGVLKNYSNEFIRGYQDFKEGTSYNNPPYLLKIRANKWKEGWLEAEKHSKK